MNDVSQDDPDRTVRMLDALDELRRKVVTGEVIGVLLGGMRKDDYFLFNVKGEPPGPHAILVFERALNRAKELFLDGHVEDNDGAPMLSIPDDSQSPEPT